MKKIENFKSAELNTQEKTQVIGGLGELDGITTGVYDDGSGQGCIRYPKGFPTFGN